MSIKPLRERVNEATRRWGITVQDSLETESSLVLFGKCGDQPVVLKVLRQPGDEWLSGKVLDVFDGKGVVRVYRYHEGAVLLERLNPGNSLAGLALEGRDERATEILAEVIQQMNHPRESLESFVTVEDWGRGFQRYLASGDTQIPPDLVEQARHLYMELCATQEGSVLLHGDLQHYNVLLDYDRGWLAIDPKGVVGEIEYEIGASLRNPHECPELFASSKVVERRLKCYETRLKIDYGRALGWSFAQAVLSEIWSVEDEHRVDASGPSLTLANTIRPMLG
jgi:streptomycin 6-kinase